MLLALSVICTLYARHLNVHSARILSAGPGVHCLWLAFTRHTCYLTCCSSYVASLGSLMAHGVSTHPHGKWPYSGPITVIIHPAVLSLASRHKLCLCHCHLATASANFAAVPVLVVDPIEAKARDAILDLPTSLQLYISAIVRALQSLGLKSYCH